MHIYENYNKFNYLEKPTCKMEDAYVMQGEEIHMKCECMAYPAAEIIWSFKSCQNPMLWPNCRDVKNINTVSKVLFSWLYYSFTHQNFAHHLISVL